MFNSLSLHLRYSGSATEGDIYVMNADGFVDDTADQGRNQHVHDGVKEERFVHEGVKEEPDNCLSLSE